MGRHELTLAQQRVWFLEQLTPGHSTYNIPAAYRLEGRLNVAVLARSLNEIVRRHEVLRTTFAVINGEPVQVIAPTLPVTLPLADLRHLPQAAREVEAQRLIAEEARQPFDLTHGPLLRAVLCQAGPEDHLLLLTLHHVVSDGWSMEVLERELSTLYAAFSAGRPSPLPELALQYADFAVWQRTWLQGEALASQLAYWRQQLAGSPPLLELPADRSRPAIQTYHGATYSFTLSRVLSQSLKALSQQEGVTLFMTLLAAFKVLLYRYTGQRDLAVGTPIANRNRVELEGLIGLFVNTLVLRTEVSGALRFRELLSRVREVCLGAYAHQDLPFEKLVEVLQPGRDLSRNPLFQVMFVFQNAPTQTLTLPGLTVQPWRIPPTTSKFDLSLFIEEAGPELLGSIEYNTDLFDTATIVRMAGHFQTLLDGSVTEPDQAISRLPLLTAAERQQILVEWNDTQVDYPHDKCLPELFEDQVQRTPDAVAVVFEDQHLTYHELNSRANQLAHYLRKLEVGPEVLVGICLERSLDMVVGLLGILKAGGAYVPLDPSYPQERLAFMLSNAKAPVLLTQARLLEQLPQHGATTVILDADWETVASETEGNPVKGVTPDNLAYVIYTSGSTGQPKGAMNTHRSICNRLLWMQDAYQLTEHDQILQKTPFSFDVSVWEFFWPLILGARLVVAQPEGHRDPTYLLNTVNQQQITTIHFVPSMLQAFLQEATSKQCQSLQRVICSGESLPVSLQDHFFKWSGADLHNLYGPTEAAVDVTFWTCQRLEGQRTVPIGRPISNVQLYLLDSDLQPVPISVPGELYLGGIAPGRGYLHQPAMTANVFFPDPFSRETGARLYRTGDLARWLPDGSLEFLGRLDHQVKIRGFRIELGEIETALGQYPDIREAVVVAQGKNSENVHLVAYVVPKQEPAAEISHLRDFLRQKLPEYLVPSAFVRLNVLPHTPNGKVDRRALPVLDETRPGLGTAFIAPQDTLEIQLAHIWEDVLNVKPIGRKDNFFALGGHSLLALRMLARVRDTFQVNIPLQVIFEEPTIAYLGAAILQSKIQQIDTQSLDQMLTMLEQLPDDGSIL